MNIKQHIINLLSQLPEKYRERAIRNIDPINIEALPVDLITDTRAAIRNAFCWSDTPEGHDFWKRVHEVAGSDGEQGIPWQPTELDFYTGHCLAGLIAARAGQYHGHERQLIRDIAKLARNMANDYLFEVNATTYHVWFKEDGAWNSMIGGKIQDNIVISLEEQPEARDRRVGVAKISNGLCTWQYVVSSSMKAYDAHLLTTTHSADDFFAKLNKFRDAILDKIKQEAGEFKLVGQ